MTRLAAFAICLFAGCASAENANSGGERDLAVPIADGGDADLATAAVDLAGDLAGGGGDGGVMVPPLSCAAGHVVVNEVQAGGAASAGDEFIELYNPCATAVALAGSTLVYRSASGTNDVLVVNLTNPIPAGGYYLVASMGYTGAAVPDQKYGGSGKLAAAGGGVGLRDAAQALIDSVGYGSATNAFIESSPAPAPPNGESIARTPNGTDTDHNASDFAVATTPTPRAAN